MSKLLNGMASFLWSVASAASRRRRSRSPRRLGARVVSVGNIQAGGAGKTPIVARIAREAHERGLKACILCRGYGSIWEVQGGVLGPGIPEVSPQICGDEAALLRELAPNAWIGVGADRGRQFDEVEKRAGVKMDWAILDDGFQNHRLKKDLEIVALTSSKRTERVFRDFRSATKSADLLVWTKGEMRPENFGKTMVRARFELPADEGGKPLLLVTGVGDSGSVAEAARKAGYRIERHTVFPDHARYSQAVVDPLVSEARALGMKIAVTGKDWVKWRELVPPGWRDSMVWVLEPLVRLDPEDEKMWNRVIWGD